MIMLEEEATIMYFKTPSLLASGKPGISSFRIYAMFRIGLTWCSCHPEGYAWSEDALVLASSATSDILAH
jgi:hypothetical protein